MVLPEVQGGTFLGDTQKAQVSLCHLQMKDYFHPEKTFWSLNCRHLKMPSGFCILPNQLLGISCKLTPCLLQVKGSNYDSLSSVPKSGQWSSKQRRNWSTVFDSLLLFSSDKFGWAPCSGFHGSHLGGWSLHSCLFQQLLASFSSVNIVRSYRPLHQSLLLEISGSSFDDIYWHLQISLTSKTLSLVLCVQLSAEHLLWEPLLSLLPSSSLSLSKIDNKRLNRLTFLPYLSSSLYSYRELTLKADDSHLPSSWWNQLHINGCTHSRASRNCSRKSTEWRGSILEEKRFITLCCRVLQPQGSTRPRLIAILNLGLQDFCILQDLLLKQLLLLPSIFDESLHLPALPTFPYDIVS